MTTPDEVIRDMNLRESLRVPRNTFSDDFSGNLNKWFLPSLFPAPTISGGEVHLRDASVQAMIVNTGGAHTWQNYTVNACIRGSDDGGWQGFGIGAYANKNTLDGYGVTFLPTTGYVFLYAIINTVGVSILQKSFADCGITIAQEEWFETSMNIQLEDSELGPRNRMRVTAKGVAIIDTYAPADYFFTRGAPGLLKNALAGMDCSYIEVPT